MGERRRRRAGGLTVAVTGPTGEIGKPFIAALEATPQVERVIGMARRPFDPASRGWTRTEYRRGDVLDRASVETLVQGADVVVHLAFIILGAGAETRHINVEGSRNVFEAAADAGVKRLVYASSVAAYGFPDIDGLITEDVPAAGHERHPYSAHKAEVERVLDDALAESETSPYVFRPCIVAGPEAPLLVGSIPFVQLGVPFQLVHHDDVASALVQAVLGRGRPGAYNLAGPGELTMRDLADALGYYSLPVPELAVDATTELVARLPFLPEEATWIEALRRPVLMDTTKARRILRWRPRHDALQTLRQTVAGASEDLSAGLR
jgi:nucleoside-diphosphate-sugar epimerase